MADNSQKRAKLARGVVVNNDSEDEEEERGQDGHNNENGSEEEDSDSDDEEEVKAQEKEGIYRVKSVVGFRLNVRLSLLLSVCDSNINTVSQT